MQLSVDTGTLPKILAAIREDTPTRRNPFGRGVVSTVKLLVGAVGGAWVGAIAVGMLDVFGPLDGSWTVLAVGVVATLSMIALFAFAGRRGGRLFEVMLEQHGITQTTNAEQHAVTQSMIADLARKIDGPAQQDGAAPDLPSGVARQIWEMGRRSGERGREGA